MKTAIPLKRLSESQLVQTSSLTPRRVVAIDWVESEFEVWLRLAARREDDEPPPSSIGCNPLFQEAA